MKAEHLLKLLEVHPAVARWDHTMGLRCVLMRALVTHIQ
jgi:hypothetical protein